MQKGKHPANIARARAVVSGLMVTFAVALSGCDEAAVVVSPSDSSSSSSAPITASIRVVDVEPQASLAVGFGCAARSFFSPTFDVIVASSRAVDLDNVTIHLIDGSNVGGPMVTVPRVELTSDFGTTFIAAGRNRSFRFRPRFPCSVRPPRFLAADLAFVDLQRMTHVIKVSYPWP
jgi:hypothetical protein